MSHGRWQLHSRPIRNYNSKLSILSHSFRSHVHVFRLIMTRQQQQQANERQAPTSNSFVCSKTRTISQHTKNRYGRAFQAPHHSRTSAAKTLGKHNMEHDVNSMNRETEIECVRMLCLLAIATVGLLAPHKFTTEGEKKPAPHRCEIYFFFRLLFSFRIPRKL